jgi:long-subunit fatty acid transport protein
LRWTPDGRASYLTKVTRVLVLVMLLTGSASAGGFAIPELGLRETAMCAEIGRPDDGSAIYHNPAGLALADGWRVSLTAGLALPRTHLALQAWDQSDRFLGPAGPDGYYPAVTPSRAFAAIPVLQVSGELLRHRLYVGASVFVGNATGAKFKEDSVAHYHLIDGYVVAPQAMAAASYRVTPSIALGAAVGVVNIRVHGRRDVFPIVMGSDVSNITGSKPLLELDGSSWAPAWSIGALGTHRRVTWGAALVGRIDTKLEGPIKVTYSDDAQSPGDTLVGSQKTTMLLPWQMNAGVNFDVSPHVEIGAELRYWLYRQYKRQHTDVVGIFLLRELDTPKNYSDSWAAGGGVRVHDLDGAPHLEVMAGTNYDKSPAPSNTITLDQPSFSHFGLHGGARYTVGRFRFGASYTHYWYVVPDIKDSLTLPPTNVHGNGDNHIITLSVEAAL